MHAQFARQQRHTAPGGVSTLPPNSLYLKSLPLLASTPQQSKSVSSRASLRFLCPFPAPSFLLTQPLSWHHSIMSPIEHWHLLSLSILTASHLRLLRLTDVIAHIAPTNKNHQYVLKFRNISRLRRSCCVHAPW